MRTTIDQDWHYEAETQETVEEFYNSYAEFPTEYVNKAKGHFHELMDRFETHLIKSGVCIQFIYTGSIVEGIKVASSTMEFDVMVILTGGEFISFKETRPCYSKLYSNAPPPSDAFRFHTKIMNQSTKSMMTDKTISQFYSRLHLFLNQNDDLRKSIKLKDHGPAVQMDVYRLLPGKNQAKFFYSVDMVPSFYLPSHDKYFVAKPFPDEEVDKSEWRLSFSLKEKAYLDMIDDNCQCQKMCMRILKVLRDRHVNIVELNSYIIKTATLSLSEDFPNLDWSHDQLGCRVIDVLKYILLALQGRELPNLFVKGHNLLHHLKDNHRENLMAYLKKIIKQKNRFDKALEGGSVFTLHLEGLVVTRQGVSEMAERKYRDISWPRMNEIVSVDYILREGNEIGQKLKAEGLLKEERRDYSCFKILKDIFLVILFAVFCYYVTKYKTSQS